MKKLKVELLDRKYLSVIKFYTDWSGPSQMILPVFRELAESYKGVAHFYEVNIEMQPDVAGHFGIREIPTLLFLRHGEVVDHATGMISRNALIAKVENALNQ